MHRKTKKIEIHQPTLHPSQLFAGYKNQIRQGNDRTNKIQQHNPQTV